jgi:hypothetical protein
MLSLLQYDSCIRDGILRPRPMTEESLLPLCKAPVYRGCWDGDPTYTSSLCIELNLVFINGTAKIKVGGK